MVIKVSHLHNNSHYLVNPLFRYHNSWIKINNHHKSLNNRNLLDIQNNYLGILISRHKDFLILIESDSHQHKLLHLEWIEIDIPKIDLQLHLLQLRFHLHHNLWLNLHKWGIQDLNMKDHHHHLQDLKEIGMIHFTHHQLLMNMMILVEDNNKKIDIGASLINNM